MASENPTTNVTPHHSNTNPFKHDFDPYKIDKPAAPVHIISPKQVVSPRIFEQDGETYHKEWNLKVCQALIKHDPRNCWAHLREAQIYCEEKKFIDTEECL